MRFSFLFTMFFFVNAMFGDSSHAYVTNHEANSVFVIDQESNTVQKIFGFVHPKTVKLLPDGQRAYVGSSDNTVRVIDTVTHTVLPQVATVTYPIAMALTPTSEFLYVLSNNNTVTVFEVHPTDFIFVTTITGFDQPQDIKIRPDGAFAYVTNAGNGTVSVIDTSFHGIVDTIVGFNTPVGMSINVDGTFGYVTDTNHNAVYVFDTTKNLLIDTIPGFNSPVYIAMSPNKPSAYVINKGNHTISILRLSDNFVVGSIPVFAPRSLATSIDGLFLYVGSDLDVVFKISLVDNSIRTTVPGFSMPSNIATTVNTSPSDSVNGCVVATDPSNLYNVITWTNGPGMPVGYRLYRDAQYTDLIAAISSGTITEYRDEHLEAGKNYFYYVLADYANGFSSSIGNVEVTPTRTCCETDAADGNTPGILDVLKNIYKNFINLLPGT